MSVESEKWTRISKKVFLLVFGYWKLLESLIYSHKIDLLINFVG